MPLTRISLRKGKPADYKKALMDEIYAAMRETFAVPDQDFFMMVHEHEADTFVYGPTYLDIARSDDLVMIQITCNDTRDTRQKAALYRVIAQRLGQKPGVRPQDVFINLIEVKAENWSFGNGIAQYATAL